MISLKKSKSGFTIVELLIVIVVIGILALLVITTYSGIQAKARNSKRQSDLKSLQTQLEAYFSQNGHYPSLGDMNSSTWLSDNMKSLDQNALIDPSNPDQSKTLVNDTKPDKQYGYVVTDSQGNTCEGSGTADTQCAKYTLYAHYEDKSPPNDYDSASNLD